MFLSQRVADFQSARRPFFSSFLVEAVVLVGKVKGAIAEDRDIILKGTTQVNLEHACRDEGWLVTVG